MGQDKAFLPFGSETLLSRALKLAGKVAEQVSIVGDAAKFAPFGTVVEDQYRDRGPLGGIHAALSATNAERNLILAVDLPFLERGFLEYLMKEAEKTKALATVSHAAGRFQPLCAIYRRGFAVLAKQALEKGRNKIDPLFEQTDARIISEDEIKAAAFSLEMFQNLNSPDDLEKALRRSDAP